MEKEIREIVEKNLPKHIGEALQERIALVETLEEKNEHQKHIIEGLRKQKEKQEATIAEYEKNDERNRKLDEREKEIQNRENNAEVESLKGKLAAEESKTSFMNSVTMGLVRNTHYRSQVYNTNEQQPYSDMSGNMIYPTPTTTDKTEHKDAE